MPGLPAQAGRLLHTTGQKGLVWRIIQRGGAWELLPHPDTLHETTQAVSHVTTCDFQKERQCIQQLSSGITKIGY